MKDRPVAQRAPKIREKRSNAGDKTGGGGGCWQQLSAGQMGVLYCTCSSISRSHRPGPKETHRTAARYLRKCWVG